MKKALLTVIALLCVSSIAVMAQDKPTDKKAEGKKGLNAEQKAELKKIIEKYDTNKDGKLDKEESAKVSPEDKAAMKKIRGVGEGKKTQGGDKKKEKQ